MNRIVRTLLPLVILLPLACGGNSGGGNGGEGGEPAGGEGGNVNGGGSGGSGGMTTGGGKGGDVGGSGGDTGGAGGEETGGKGGGAGGKGGNGGGGKGGAGGSTRDGGAPDTGLDSGAPDKKGGGSDGPPSASWAAVQKILAAECVRCHDPAHPVVPETVTFVEMDLTAAGAYAALVNQPAHQKCGGTRVVPGDANASYLFHKVNDDKPCEGERMPHAGMIAVSQKLPKAQIDTIAGWIGAGAPR